MDGAYIYPRSVRELKGEKIYMERCGDGTERIVWGEKSMPADHAAAQLLRAEFDFCRPSRVLGAPRTFGVGDRLGKAGDGHLMCFEGRDVLPVLAQQSIRELNLTGRSFEDVLDAATFAVFRQGRERPWGADGDHLKTCEEIEYAISCGYTMLTLDCSEKIGMGGQPTQEQRSLYLSKSFTAEEHELRFDEAGLSRACATYGLAIDYICSVYEKYVAGGELDFEISIDETSEPTAPAEHFFVASELTRRGVRFETMAPRFCGEFQKGIDYIGDIGQFEKEIAVHAAIARRFGYKLSIHSSSDKFSVYPLIARYTRGQYHVKTAGTNWLEAMKLVAMTEPGLYRRAHALALESFAAASKYYHVSARPESIAPLSSLSDGELAGLFENNDARQLIHITYGQLLNSELREELFAVWSRHREEYYALLGRHIGKHLDLLGE